MASAANETSPPNSQTSSLLALPAELIQHILTILPLFDVVRIGSTCRLLHQHSLNDLLWHAHVNENLHSPITSPYPAESFRDLYLRLQPYWFVTRHKVWYSDSPLHGKIILARYDARRGCIEAHSFVANRDSHEHGLLPWPNQVIYDTFRPKISLDLNRPILRLDPRDITTTSANGFSAETKMRTHSGDSRRICSVFMPTRKVIHELKTINPNSMWPPQLLPSPGNQRTRNQSPSFFHSSGHTPCSSAELSDATFRIRQWVEYSHSIPMAPPMHHSSRIGEAVHTWATLPEESYTPTKQKPWQGIWCGDYGGHGCEFLLVLQPDDPLPLPDKAQVAFDHGPKIGANRNNFGLVGMISPELDDNPEDHDLDDEGSFYGGVPSRSSNSPIDNHSRPYFGPSPTDRPPYKGRLEAIKLTGDPNIPRGEYTFIAPDIGINGLVGYASDAVFSDPNAQKPSNSSNGQASSSSSSSSTNTYSRPARIVKGVGHIAGTGFSDDTYIPTQLIMISENRLAQYWLPFRHVSFFERVDLQKLLNM